MVFQCGNLWWLYLFVCLFQFLFHHFEHTVGTIRHREHKNRDFESFLETVAVTTGQRAVPSKLRCLGLVAINQNDFFQMHIVWIWMTTYLDFSITRFRHLLPFLWSLTMSTIIHHNLCSFLTGSRYRRFVVFLLFFTGFFFIWFVSTFFHSQLLFLLLLLLLLLVNLLFF